MRRGHRTVDQSHCACHSEHDHGHAYRYEPLPADLAEIQAQIEGYARDYGLDFFPTIFEVVDADQLNAIAAYGGFPDALSALALRHGVRAALQGLHVRPAKDLRAGDQQQSLLRLPDAVATRSRIRSW